MPAITDLAQATRLAKLGFADIESLHRVRRYVAERVAAGTLTGKRGIDWLRHAAAALAAHADNGHGLFGLDFRCVDWGEILAEEVENVRTRTALSRGLTRVHAGAGARHRSVPASTQVPAFARTLSLSLPRTRIHSAQ